MRTICDLRGLKVIHYYYYFHLILYCPIFHFLEKMFSQAGKSRNLFSEFTKNIFFPKQNDAHFFRKFSFIITFLLHLYIFSTHNCFYCLAKKLTKFGHMIESRKQS